MTKKNKKVSRGELLTSITREMLLTRQDMFIIRDYINELNEGLILNKEKLREMFGNLENLLVQYDDKGGPLSSFHVKHALRDLKKITTEFPDLFNFKVKKKEDIRMKKDDKHLTQDQLNNSYFTIIYTDKEVICWNGAYETKKDAIDFGKLHTTKNPGMKVKYEVYKGIIPLLSRAKEFGLVPSTSNTAILYSKRTSKRMIRDYEKQLKKER